MTEETAITIPEDVRAAFMALEDDYLADVLRLWDCELKCWHDPMVMIFRFESDDVLVWHEDSTLRCWRGAINDCGTSSLVPDGIEIAIDRSACLCWISDKSYNALIGETTASQRLLSSFK